MESRFPDSRIPDWEALETIQAGGTVVHLERRALVHVVFDSTQTGDWKHLTSPGTVPLAVLRSVVLYCFALNICATEEIVEESSACPVVCYLCANHTLDWQTVHEFRRRNTAPLLDALARLLNAIFDGVPTRSEAELRLRRAVQADSIVLDQ